jgi:hypothetical protein
MDISGDRSNSDKDNGDTIEESSNGKQRKLYIKPDTE